MEMQQIRYFLSLAKTLNFTRAAEECKVSQPALTRAIQALEIELGGDLVRRERQNSHLTELGKRMLPLLQASFESASAAKELARSVAANVLAPLSVAVSHSLSLYLFSQELGELHRAFSGVQIRIVHGQAGEILELLRDGEAEIALAGPLDEEWVRLDAWPLFEENFSIAIARSNPLAGEARLSCGQLAHTPLIRQPSCEMRPQAAELLRGTGLFNQYTHDVVTLADQLALAQAGVGAAIVPTSTYLPEDLVRIPFVDLDLRRTISAYAVAGRQRGPALSAFLNLVRSADYEAKFQHSPGE